MRDELLGREIVDLDIACREPEATARAYAKRSGGAPFPLSERHGAWRVALEGGRTVDFTPLDDGIEDDLATRDFTINAIAVPLAGGEAVDPYRGQADLEAKVIRAVSPNVFTDDPLRLLRAVRLEDELGFLLEPETERLVREQAELVTKPARERSLAELVRLSVEGYRRADELGLLAPLEGSSAGLDRPALVDRPAFRLVAVFGDALRRFPVSNETKRYAQKLLRGERPEDGSPACDSPVPARDRALGARRARLRRCAGARGRGPVGAGERAAGAAAPRRRARATAWAGDRTSAGADRRGARCRDDLDPRGGPRARQARARIPSPTPEDDSPQIRDRHVRFSRVG